MKRKYLSALLMGALTVASVSTMTSCKDYDDDISNLQQQIDSNAKAIKELSDLIKAGSVITSVDQITNGVKVTLSNGKTFDITNGIDGAAGAPGTTWSISEDVYANYKKLFNNGAKDGYTDREIAMSLFQKSKQSQETIDEV